MKSFSRQMPTILFASLFALGIEFSAAQEATSTPKKKPADSLQITTNDPMAPITLRDMHSSKNLFSVYLKNTSTEPIVVSPYLKVELLDAKKKPIKKSMAIGRFGRSPKSALESIPFVKISPGQSHEIKINFNRYLYDPMVITGWKTRSPGKHHLVLHYQYDRKQIKRDYGRGCQTIEDPDQPWNKAVEVNKKIRLAFEVKKSATE